MFLQNISIRNFRNLQHLDATFERGLNVIVGPNNIGKTNLFLAIRHCLGPSASRGDALALIEDDLFRKPQGEPITEPIRIDITFAGLSGDQFAQFFEIMDFDHNDLTKSTAKIHFEANWSKDKSRFSIKRWGGPVAGEHSQIPPDIIEALPLTFLPALRDAEISLMPGSRSRLARVLGDLSRQSTDDHETEIVRIFSEANQKLKDVKLISDAENKLNESAKEMAGNDFSRSSIAAMKPEFSRVLRTLRILIDENPVPELGSSGLGYNNLLYLATVLAQIEIPPKDECPVLLIEEPEAHLHPQLVVLLAKYLAKKLSPEQHAQAIVSSHSPTFAANVKPSQVLVMFKDNADGIHCNALARLNLEPTEERQLQRMLDITKASLYFSKALILVEGISEALLLPELAERLGHDLGKSHISVIPICGVAFETFKALFGADALGIRVAILTDSDPPVTSATKQWKDDLPKSSAGEFEKSARTTNLLSTFERHPTVNVFCSDVTLEYDLANAGPPNPDIMASVWEQCFLGTPHTLNTSILGLVGSDHRLRTLTVWRGICRADHSGSKAEFAHLLTEWLAQNRDDGGGLKFEIPQYIIAAIKYVTSANVSLILTRNEAS